MTVPEGDLSVVTRDAKCPATPAEEKNAILDSLEAAASQVKEGDKLFLVTFRWWKQWLAYVGQEAPNNCLEGGPVYCSNPAEQAEAILRRPFSIENSDLIVRLKREDDLELRDTLLENRDYVILPEKVWAALHKCHGGDPAHGRKGINSGSVLEDALAVELYPLRLWLTVAPNGSQLIVRVSKQDTGGELFQKACELFNLGSEQIRIWDYFGKTKHGLVNDQNHAVQDTEIQMDHEVLLEVQVDGGWSNDNSDNSFFENGSMGKELALVTAEPSRLSFSIAGGPIGSRNSTRSSSLDSIYSYSSSSLFDDLDGGLGYSGGGPRAGPLGLTGLLNLGNTCFMNSALQCLVHTPQLVDFFLQDYSKEINHQNPLGMEGELALAFGELLQKLWSPGRQPVAPRAFKAKLARFAPQFSGYNQHDSQELLAFLLDGLHEDLNRVKLKPYIESKDTDGRPDEEVAHENWENHKARNDSIIVDICQGQYKSTLVCPECRKVSVTFDPFMYLSLPLPSTATRTLTIRVFSCDGIAAPTPYTVTVSKQARCKDLILAIGKACNLRSDERILLTELYNYRPFRVLEDHLDWVSSVRDDDHVTAHRLPKTTEKAPLLVFINRRLEEAGFLPKQAKNFGSPLIACLPVEGLGTGSELANIFLKLLRPLVKVQDPLSLEHAENGRQENGASISMDEDADMAGTDMLALNGRTDDVASQIVKACEVGVMKQDCPHFCFWLTEERFLARDVPIELDKPLPAVFNSVRMNIHVAVDWSEKALEQYDIKQLEAIPETFRPGFSVKKPRQESVSLYNCLEAFLKEEPLGPEDMWYCPQCKEHRQASKKLDLWRLPEILVVHLKRFSYNRYLKNKLETFVNFPIHDLEFTKYISRKDGALYELYAVSNHYGSMGGGHYTAYVKLIDDNRWYNFDDSHVCPVGEEEIKTAAAYVLFYRRVRTGNGALTNGALSHEETTN